MITKITRILLVGLIIAIAVMFIYLNPNEITLQYGPNSNLTLMAGVIYLICFTFGLAASLFFWVLYGVKTYFRERALLAAEKKSRDFYAELLEARSLLAAKENRRAQDRWQRLIKRDPTDIIARVELSRSLEDSGDKRQALKMLDKARATDPTNVEVLLRAAKLNLALGNKTAAVDNLALVLSQEPNVYAAKLARDLSEELGRIQDAVEYNETLESLSGQRNRDASARYAYLLLENDRAELSESEYIKKLKKLANERQPSREAIAALARHAESSGNTTEAADVLIKGAKQLNSRTLWREAIELWLACGDIDRAISAAKTAVREAKTDDDKVESSLDVARLNLSIGDGEAALSQLNSISSIIQNQEQQKSYLTLKGASYSILDRHGDEREVWQELSLALSPFGGNNQTSQKALPGVEQKQLPAPTGKNGSAPKQQPSPELSTP